MPLHFLPLIGQIVLFDYKKTHFLYQICISCVE